MWVVIRHPGLEQQAVVDVDTLPHHRQRGWVRVSEPANDKDSLHTQQYADAPDLDAEHEDQAEPAHAPPQKKAAKATTTTTATRTEEK